MMELTASKTDNCTMAAERPCRLAFPVTVCCMISFQVRTASAAWPREISGAQQAATRSAHPRRDQMVSRLGVRGSAHGPKALALVDGVVFIRFVWFLFFQVGRGLPGALVRSGVRKGNAPSTSRRKRDEKGDTENEAPAKVC